MSVPPQERLDAGRVLAHLGVMAAVAAVLGVLVAGLAIPFAGLAGVGARNLSRSVDDLPAELKTEALPQKTQIVDAKGNTIASIYDENRVNVSLSQVSRIMVKSIVSIEDYRFYQHGALDLKGTLRALITNQASGGVVQGGSSITQQMVKLTLVQQANTKAERAAATDDSYARKIRELRYAIAFEQHYSKDWILERYLNLAYFGDGAFGIQAAARHYFNVNAKDLDLRQSALLAGLVRNPTGYDPTNNQDAAVNRRNTVLDRMAELSVISHKKASKTKKMPLGLDVQPSDNGCVNSLAPFYCDYVLNFLWHDKSLGKTVDERKQLIRSGGLTIHTPLDLRFQKAADTSVQAHVYPTDQAIGGLAMIEPQTGDLKALSQSRPMGSDKAHGQTFLNYVVPKEYGDSNGFQAGSTFKAFVLAQALIDHVPPDTSLTVPAQEHIEMDRYSTCGGRQYTSSEVWEPSNFDGRGGTYDLYTGTQNSVNTFFANLELLTGLCDPYRLAKSMGVHLTLPNGDANGNGAERIPSFTLGVIDVSPMEMAEAYATFANRGQHCDSRAVTRIDDANGNVIKNYPVQCQQVMPTAVADTVNDILKGVMEPGGFGQYITTSQQDAGKTGTTQDGKAVWFVGYTPNLATASMIAGANQAGVPIPLGGQTVGGQPIYEASGSGIAGPMWGQAMRTVEQWLPDLTFTPPNLAELAGTPAQVPSVSGMSVYSATQTLKDAGFRVVVGESRSSGYAAGTIAYSEPRAGEMASEGSPVFIYPSSGYTYTPPSNSGGGGGGGGGGNNGGGHGHGHGHH
jgi:membrane peptidoglycan carboxypeptidase